MISSMRCEFPMYRYSNKAGSGHVYHRLRSLRGLRRLVLNFDASSVSTRRNKWILQGLEAQAAPTYLEYMEHSIDLKLAFQRYERHGRQYGFDICKADLMDRLALWKTRMTRPRPEERKEPLPVTDLFAFLKRRKQRAPSVEEKRRKQQEQEEVKAFRKLEEDVLWRHEMEARSSILGNKDVREEGDGESPDFVSSGFWVTDVVADVLGPEKPCHSKRFPREGLHHG